MARTRKSDFYRLRLQLALDQNNAANLAGVTLRTIRNWDKKGAPHIAMRLFYLWDKRAVREPGWEGWMFSRGALQRGKIRIKPQSLLMFQDWLTEKQRNC